MGYFGFLVFLALVGLAVWFGVKLVVPSTLNERNSQGGVDTVENPLIKFVRAGTVATLIILVAVFTGFKMVKTVENGHIGIVKQFGSYVDTTGEGLVFIMPWQSIAQVSVQNEVKTYKMYDTGDDTVGSAVSSDSQPVFMTVAVDYSLDRDQAVPLYKITGGQFVSRKLDKAVPQITKEVTAQYKATDFAKNRENIRLEIIKRLNATLTPLGLSINTVSLTNVDFTDALKKAIESTVEAEQNAKRAEAQVKIKEAEADQLVATAEGIAKANIKEAEGEARANKLREQALTPAILQKLAIEKLNPKVQLIYCPPKSVCLPNGGNITPVTAP
jgi:prohibitin 2